MRKTSLNSRKFGALRLVISGNTEMVRFALLLLLMCCVVYSDGSCGGHIYVESPTPFLSPNYPNNYSPQTACTWIITGQPSRTLHLVFKMFSLEQCDACSCDALEIRDGSTSSSGLLGKFCGTTLPTPLVSSTNHFYITFKSDSSAEFAGFSSFFHLAMCDSSQLTCAEDDKCISQIDLCDGKKDCSSGIDERRCDPCDTSDLNIPYATVHKNCDEDTKVEHLSTVWVVCKKGYTTATKFEKSVHCVNGNWSNIPVCVPSCAVPTHLPENIQLIEPYNVTYFQEDRTFIKCSIGYFVADSTISSILMITCKGNDVWLPAKLQCLPHNHFHYIYKPQSVEIVEAQEGQTLTLICKPETQLPTSNNAQLSFKWLKNTVDLNTISNINFTITAEGNLVLLNVSAEYAEYSCLQMEQLKYMTSSNVTYIVKMKTACLPSPLNSTITVQQNTSATMFCPHAGSEILDPPIWFNTKGERIFSDVNYSFISNAGILLKSVRYSDQGLYTCDLGPNTPFCERYFTTNLKVIPTNEDICGISHKSSGFPWLVTLWWNDEMAPFCYGTLVHELWVLTTAFCLTGVHRKRNPDIFVKFGQQSLQDPVVNSNTIPVEYAKIHPQYSMRINMADIGVIKLKKPVTYTNDITPICLSGDDFKTMPDNSSCEPLPPLTGNVSGLGSLEAELKPPGAECMGIATEESCPTCPTTPAGVSCAKGCNSIPEDVADTGSPFQILRHGKIHLYGIFSWGERRAKLSDFDYFTTVHPYYKWIASYINRKD